MRLGVVGTLVWDTIHARDPSGGLVEEWGGIAYGLAAAAAASPAEWEVVPIVKLGEDLAEDALRFLRGIPGVDVEPGIRIVPHPNNRVELRYRDESRRCERLTGGVPPWEWSELEPVVREVDALYVNFISGFEMELATARSIREAFDGPCYADLHSLFLGITASGERVPRRLPSWADWLRSFDVVQVNEDEFGRLGGDAVDPWRLAADAVGPALRLVVITLGSRGAAYVAAPDAAPDAGGDPSRWLGSRETIARPGATRSGRVPVKGGEVSGDPTGCGDVWGATFFVRLLRGDGVETAMAEANRLARRNVEHRGASGLHHHLRGRIAPGDEG